MRLPKLPIDFKEDIGPIFLIVYCTILTPCIPRDTGTTIPTVSFASLDANSVNDFHTME